jgi:hypothetical protein
MDVMSQEELIAILGKDLVAQVAPQELPLFRATSQAYFQDPNKLLKAQTPKDEMLGFGSGEAVMLLTPFVLSILTEIVKYLANEFATTVKSEGAGYINELVKQSFQKFRRQPEAGPSDEPGSEPDAETAAEQPQVAVGEGSETAGGQSVSPAAPGAAVLSKEQLAQIYEVALRKAKDLKLSDSKATLLADSVVGSLAIA